MEEVEEGEEGRTDRWPRIVERLTFFGRWISFYPPHARTGRTIGLSIDEKFSAERK